MSVVWISPLVVWVCCAAGLIVWYRKDLCALWREPVLRYPVLIVESDDWGAGPAEQADALERLIDVLDASRDTRGRRPVMTIAVVLAVPDGRAMRSGGGYRRRTLAEAEFAPVREALLRGARRGVFALQLHGMEHYWPATLMASDDPAVRRWVLQEAPPATEALPAHLQSRWIDARMLPSGALPEAEVEAATAEEVALFAEVFGEAAKVVVPPTFIWSEAVEAAWARHGVQFVVAAGRRYGCRDASGQPACAGGAIRNGERGAGVGYVVRDEYFEPGRGHTVEHGLAALGRKTRQGRPCLLETHRANFIGADAERAYGELNALIDQALRRHPHLGFMSTQELAEALLERRHDLLETRLLRRLAAWRGRWPDLPRFWTLARATGLALIMQAVTT